MLILERNLAEYITSCYRALNPHGLAKSQDVMELTTSTLLGIDSDEYLKNKGQAMWKEVKGSRSFILWVRLATEGNMKKA
ncbi:hypothetical protein SAY87_003521 [Trapa incisa]|uniref:Uncharacterized protein n=1 Tax=Trapa incisa TaxID=236973 RepID=A0AAN7QLA1_9MYRT|nr:hypothetical protein SAY87_003521 [Trapa incisa]